METKHTKGEWKIRRLFESPIFIQSEDGREWYTNTFDIHGETGRIICSVDYMTDVENQGWGKNNYIDLWEANAKLIAAAPDMLEALKEIKRLYGDRTDYIGEYKNAWEKVENTIKKATE